ncbi:lytic transglycosylase domain-containing protein [Niabella ginsengisoli]|uniref:Lytic transglycosylase domain-containing protein n=1 Tax=Niabella ginsengisoli TaxID=522298 RepID=A0ABS9SEY0_9BACT|nr:lytic transglycosylase domain-containing protein [Niabella ginsengisoli]MCH5596913.1 lytic transglycosylase domain-containing protein [Niabella ginsengisoli]
MKKITFGGLLFFAGIGVCFTAMSLFGFKEQPAVEKIAVPGLYKAPALPDSMSFAGETVPLERREINEQLDRELTYNYFQPQNVVYIIKLAERFFPQIEAVLQANNVPDDFKYLCVAESNLQNLISKVGATGFWQFMAGTAPGYNLEVSGSVDERYHVIKSTEAACKYLKQAYNRFGSWTAAAASYNCGMGGYNQRVTQQGSKNYYDLVLPEETNRYIFRILTFKHLLANAESLGYDVADSYRYTSLKTKNITVTQTIPNLVSFAKSNGTSFKVLKTLNPWLRSNTLQVRAGKTYDLLLPE